MSCQLCRTGKVLREKLPAFQNYGGVTGTSRLASSPPRARLLNKGLSSSSPAPSGTRSRKPQADPDTVLFYRWPTMRHFRFISKFKLYQVSLMGALVPPALYWYSVDKLTTGGLVCGGVALVGTSAVLGVVSYYFSRLAGEMRYNAKENSLRLSTLTFWGNRKEVELPADGVVTFVESQTRMGGAFQRLEVKGRGEVWLWSMRYGRVLDLEVLCRVLKITDTDLSHF